MKTPGFSADRSYIKRREKLNRVDSARHDFTNVRVLSEYQWPVQPKLNINQPRDKYKHETDQTGDMVKRSTEPQLRRNYESSGGEPEYRKKYGQDIVQTKLFQKNGVGERLVLPHIHGVLYPVSQIPDLISRSNLHSLHSGQDLGRMRIHTVPRMEETAPFVNDRIFKSGNYFESGDKHYRPHQNQGRPSPAHEPTHIFRHGLSGRGNTDTVSNRISVLPGGSQIQRSPLSDSVIAANATDPSLEALLARLAQNDIQNAQSDTDIDAELVRILAGRPQDLWVAQQIRQGQLVENSGRFGRQRMPGNPIRVHFFRGTTNRRALVIAGVHGSEVQGIEVARHLITDLQRGMAATPPRLPVFSVIVVPSLFPDNAAARRREGAIPTNRNFPSPRQTLATATRDAAGRPRDARNRRILTENILLMALMERFHPQRIISIHGTWRAGAAGVFYDPRQLTSTDERAVRTCVYHGDTEANCRRMLLRGVSMTDRDLSLATARAIETSTSSITGREGRRFGNREGEPHPVPRAQVAARRSHPSVAGNVGTSGTLDTAHWSGQTPGGYSLGDYASARGMSIFTVEPPLNCTTADYAPGGRCRGRASGVSETERRLELMSYAEAIRSVLLGS